MFDLDPPAEDFAPVRTAARGLHELLDELELPSLLMTTGSRGLHIVIALDRREPFDDVRAFAHDAAEECLVETETDRDQYAAEVAALRAQLTGQRNVEEGRR